jgi:CheY-like chemotaxis protein
MTMPYRVLVIDDDEHALDGLAELLRNEGYDVTPTASYEEAKTLLAMRGFDLLVTDVRLRSYNGLHLVKKTRAESPDIGIIIMTAYEDALMELEARRYNAQFVRKPVKPVQFLQAVGQTLGGIRRQRRWPRKQVTGGFRVIAAGVPAAVMDVCYGGLRLQLATSNALPARFEVAVQGIGLNLEVQPVWSHAVEGGTLCGAALATESSPAAHTWRAIVDRLTA